MSTGRVVAGIGFRRECPAEAIVALVYRALALADLGGADLDALATLAARAHDPALRDAAARLAVPIRAVATEALVRADPRGVTRSPRILALHGVGSVAEAAALAAAGAATLLLPRLAEGGATCALARQPRETAS